MSSFLVNKSPRKGGPKLHFGRPLATSAKSPKTFSPTLNPGIKEKCPQTPPHHHSTIHAVTAAESPGSNWLTATQSKEQSETQSETVNAKSFAWVHRRDKEEVRIRHFDTIKRKLRAAAYSSRGIEYKTLFKIYDQDNDAGLDLNEFRHAFRIDGKVSKSGLSDQSIEQVFLAIDVDNSGFIEYKEFVEWLNTPTARPLSSSSPPHHPQRPTSPISKHTIANRTNVQQQKHHAQKQYKSEGQLHNELKKIREAKRFKRSDDLEKQRNNLVEQWWNKLYGSKRKTNRKSDGKGGRHTTENASPTTSIVGGQPTDPVFSRLYPYKFSRQKLPVTVSTTAAVAKLSSTAARGEAMGGTILDWNKAKQSEEYLRNGTIDNRSNGRWNTSTLVVKERVAARRRFNVL
jgi:Ca2+-binding EF-hand superfamily protein